MNKVMAHIHQLIVQQGVEEARRQAVTKHERMVVEAAYQVLSEEAEKLSFAYSGFALTCLPHKPQKETVWRREGHNLTMLMQSGLNRTGDAMGGPVRELRALHPAVSAKPSHQDQQPRNRAWAINEGLAQQHGPLDRRHDVSDG